VEENRADFVEFEEAMVVFRERAPDPSQAGG
jgi:hypothetical protein